MTDQFSFDVFISHSAKDKPIVRPIAERLRADGLRVWFDEWEIKPGDSIPVKIEEGLENSRVLVLCMSANAFGSDWARLESGTFRFQDPLNKERRFLTIRLDAAPIKGSLAQFRFIDWSKHDQDEEYLNLLKHLRNPPRTHDLSIDNIVPREEETQASIDQEARRPSQSACMDRNDVAQVLAPILAENRTIWSLYGPENDDRFNPECDTPAIWLRKVRERIIPNNRSILSICDEYGMWLTTEERSIVEVLRQHSFDLEAKHLKGIRAPAIQFPQKADTLFTD